MDEIENMGRMSDMEFWINVLNNLPKEYWVVLDNLETCLRATDEAMLTHKALTKKLNSRFERINSKKGEKYYNDRAFSMFS